MVITALIFILVLSGLVLIHEFGHFIVARIIGVKVEEFGIGIPPRMFGKKIKGILWSINWLPVGGFVRLAGEDPDDINLEKAKAKTKKERMKYFWARSKSERAAILMAGVAMNFLLAWGITSFLLTHGIIEPAGYVHVESVVPGSPAEMAGLHVYDKINRVEWTEHGQEKEMDIHVPDDLISFVNAHGGESIILTLSRDGEELSLSIIPRRDPPEGEGPLGISISDLEKRKYPIAEAPWKGLVITVERTGQMITSIGSLLWRLISGGTIEKAEIAGPVGIAQVTGQAVKYGWETVLEFVGILSLNLALLNILPFPALDGGRLAFVVLERFGKKARPDIERIIHQFGMLFLLALIVLITINDILRIVRG